MQQNVIDCNKLYFIVHLPYKFTTFGLLISKTMATINFLYRSVKEKSNLHLRLLYRFNDTFS